MGVRERGAGVRESVRERVPERERRERERARGEREESARRAVREREGARERERARERGGEGEERRGEKSRADSNNPNVTLYGQALHPYWHSRKGIPFPKLKS